MYVLAPTCGECGTPIRADDEYCDGCDTRVEAIDTDGYERIQCSHPSEYATVESVLGPDVSEEIVDQRTGYNSYCVCLSCLSQFELDLDRDERQCPKCGVTDVKSEEELVDEPCPKCPTGTFVEVSTGAMV